ncbi:uncharacterized protein [Nicotiana sylvestris]|uniref:uncharacterized protein n=1 Tax=Nicotiana sylvestris TaxID=4096 RepID=UPI00388CA301
MSNLDETEVVNMGDAENVEETRIGVHLSPSEKEEYTEFLKEYEDIFSWTYGDMTGLSTSIVSHKLSTDPTCPPIEKVKLEAESREMRIRVPTRKLLGFIVSRRGIELDPLKAKAIQELPPPKNKKDVMSFLGRLNYISRFIAQSTVICEPIFKMLEKDAATKWTSDCQKAFDKIKEYLSTPLGLVPPEPAIKGQALADHLAENPIDGEYKPLKMYFPDEEVSFIGEDVAECYDGWRMFFDGAANFKGVGIGAVLISETGQHYPVSAKLRFPCTNNMAKPCILGLKMAIDMNIQELLNLDKNFIDPIPVKIHDHPAYCAHVKEEADGKPWFHDIKEYLTKGEYQSLQIPLKSAQFGGYLTISFTAEESCTRGLLMGVIKIHADMIKVPPNELNATSSPWLFVVWGMDVIGPIEPAASNGHRIPESIITDNGSNLSSYLMKAMCETFKIKHKNSTAYRPQMNGAIEASNKNIKKILRKMVEKHKQWHEKLSFALLGYRTTVRISTGATHYMLVYGTKAVITAEVEIPSLRIIQEAELDNAKRVKSRYEQLALIDGKRMNAVCHGQLY